ncbi:DUF6985 domain-containing protein [Prosthecobacter sp.]|uniref:DUF6985 domain-containing protein n=1 Tax=Prosthecobacter sp. TaxID=1965333 RepID=UPI003784CC93
MKLDIRKNFLTHPVLGAMDAFYVPGGLPYLVTGRLRIGALPFESSITLWTDPENPADIALTGAVGLVQSGADFRAEVERRFFEDYTTCTRPEYLEYARDPGYGIDPSMLPEIHEPHEVWSFLRPCEHGAVSVHEPGKFYPSQVAEVCLSFSVPFDAEHDFTLKFRDGKFAELTR